MPNLLRILLLIFVVTACSQVIVGQSSTLPLNPQTYHTLDRLEILHGSKGIYHSAIKYFSRKDATEFALATGTDAQLSELDRSDLQYIFVDNDEWYQHFKGKYDLDYSNPEQIFEKIYLDSSRTFFTIKKKDPLTFFGNTELKQERDGFLGIFYKSPADFLSFETEDFFFKLNPIVNFKLGRDSAQDDPIFQNTRGFQIRGAIDNKVYFYSSLFENQQHFLQHINQRISRDNAVPGNGYYKTFESSVSSNYNGFDFLNAQAFVGFNISKSIGLEFGHGKHFIGNGYNSLLLDDYGHNYFYLKFNSKFWKLHYQNIFAELASLSSFDNQGDVLLPKKYMAAHYLDFEFTENFSIGIYEAIVFNRNNNFEFQYLNPVIIYRTVEQFLDSPDNVLIGLNTKWNFKKQFQLYGQFILDEFDLDELRNGDGYWGNKYALQLGLKYINVANIDHLDMRVEFNLVKPFTYQHRDSLIQVNIVTSKNISPSSYSHFSQPLTHPLGANFREFLLTFRYQFSPKLTLNGRYIAAKTGLDPEGENYGADVLLNYETRIQDFDNFIGQGTATNISLLGIDASYELYHNIFADLHLLIRKQNSDIDVNDINTTYFGAGVRMNIANQRLDY